MSITGEWRITEMDRWDRDAIDLLGPAYIHFGNDREGEFRFIAVEGWMDCRHGERNGQPLVEFTWNGNEEGDPVSGRGWAAIEDNGPLSGHIFFHHGDDSGFMAVRAEDAAKPSAKTRSRARPGRR
jgi:hypothetical protein